MKLIDDILKCDIAYDRVISDLVKFLSECKDNPQKIHFLNDIILKDFSESFIQENVRHSGAVIILTPGKSGSQTLQSTLFSGGHTDNQLVIRSHFHSNAIILEKLIQIGVGPQKKVSELESALLQVLIAKVAQVLLSSKGQFYQVPVNVLTILRNDIDVAFASIFQNWRTHFSSVENISPKTFEKFLRQWYDPENPFLLVNWCETELVPLQQNQKTRSKLRLYTGGYETIFQSEELALEFLSKAGFRRNRLVSKNIGAQKEYSIKYEEVRSLKSIMLSRIFLSSPIAI